MAKIQIYSDTQKGCIFFDNSTVEPKFLGTVVAEIKADEPDRIHVFRTDRRRQDGVTFRTIFRRLNPNRVQNQDGQDLVGTLGYSVGEVVDYINEQASSYQAVTAARPDLDDHPNFTLDATGTSIMVDNGESFGVNTLKAILGDDGLIDIVSSDFSGNAVTFYEDCPVDVFQIAGETVTGGPNDVVNKLNELFTAGPFEAVVISDPYATMIADVDGVDAGYTLEGDFAVDPVGNDIFTTTSTHNNKAGLKSVDTIDQAGEYFTFDIRGEGQIGFGLIHTQESYDAGHYSGNATYANPDAFANGVNSAHYGFQFSHWFHPTPNGSWTNYGANTGFARGAGWSNWDQKQDWLDGNPVKMRVGLDTNGYISIESLQDDGTFVVHARSSYPAPEGSSFHLGINAANNAARVYSAPKVHLLEPEAPTMYFRYIESPDGTYHWPLFATQEEADYYDKTTQGSETGESHTHVYVDDPTNTTWYMPEHGNNMGSSIDPTTVINLFEGQPVTYTEITSLSNADLTPPAFQNTTIYIDELTQLNYQVSPVDVGYATTIATAVPGWSLVGNAIMGTAPEVAGDNVSNPTDFTTVTVTRTNSYGSSYGVLTVFINNLTAPAVTPIAGVTHEGGTAMVDADTMGDGSVISIDDVVENGNRVVLDKEWLDNYVLPAITSGSGSKSVWVGFAAQGVTPDYGTISNADFRLAYEFNCDDNARANNNWRLKTHIQGTSLANVGIGSTTSGLYDYVFINEGDTLRAGAIVASQGHNASTLVFDANDAAWNWTLYNSSTVGSQDLIVATQNTTLDLSLTEFNEYAEPNPAPELLTNWTKALDFSGGAERAQMVSTSSTFNPLMMRGVAGTTSVAPATPGNTTDSLNGAPWATSVVFKYDGHNSNQHIWNAGEGTNGDNIYLRMSSNGYLYFGWGRDGAGVNECSLGGVLATDTYWGVYIASNGTRLSGANATATNLADAFDIYLMRTNDAGEWVTKIGTKTDAEGNRSIASNWTSNGVRMDRSTIGAFTVGGRGSNRSFHGKVASMVVTTLMLDTPMPTKTEAEMMITDPVRWVDDYKVGNSYRLSHNGTNYTNFQRVTHGNGTYTSGATQVWLMGDGPSDSYSNMIRNYIQPADQNNTKLNMISMVSNDIQNVTIPGLS